MPLRVDGSRIFDTGAPNDFNGCFDVCQKESTVSSTEPKLYQSALGVLTYLLREGWQQEIIEICIGRCYVSRKFDARRAAASDVRSSKGSFETERSTEYVESRMDEDSFQVFVAQRVTVGIISMQGLV